MYYYQHHIGDFKRDTAMLTDHQTVAYLRLMWMYYDTEKPLPNDPRKLAFMVSSDVDTVQILLEHFFTLDESGVWKHSRCDQEIERYQRTSLAGRKAAKARWNNGKNMPPQSDRNAIALNNDAIVPKTDANQEPITNKKDIGQKRKRFVPPTPEDVKAFALANNLSLDSNSFVDFYASKDWMVGKNKMKDWNAAARNWARRNQTEPVTASYTDQFSLRGIPCK